MLKALYCVTQFWELKVKTKKQQVCQANDFLVAEIDAKVGGIWYRP